MRRASLLGLLALVVPLLAPTAPAGAATVVSNSGVPSPLFVSNTTLGFCSGPGGGGSATHVNGPGTPPLGAGSLELQSGQAPDAVALARTFSSTPASALTAFKVAHFEPTGTAPQAVSMEIDVLPSGALTTDQLFLQPGPTNGTWATVDLLSASTQLNVQGNTTTYAQYLQDHPGASLISIEVYDKTCTTNQVVYVDDLVIGLSGVTTTYDFEAPRATLAPTTSASTITAGGHATVRVVATDSSSAPVAGAQVRLFARTYPATTFRLLATATTSPSGVAAIVVSPRVRTTYRWVMPPVAYAPVTSALRTIQVRTALTAHASDTTLTRTQALVVSGTTLNHRPGATVRLLRTTPSGPTVVASSTVARDGSYRIRHALPRGAQHVFVHIGAGDGELANSSPTITVTVG